MSKSISSLYRSEPEKPKKISYCDNCGDPIGSSLHPENTCSFQCLKDIMSKKLDKKIKKIKMDHDPFKTMTLKPPKVECSKCKSLKLDLLQKDDLVRGKCRKCKTVTMFSRASIKAGREEVNKGV